jgi:hypothetical protein
VLGSLLVVAFVALGNPQALGRAAGEATSGAAALRATSPAVEAVLPLRLEQPGDRVGHAWGSEHRLPLGMAVVGVGLAALAVALTGRPGCRLLVAEQTWGAVPPARGPPAFQLVAT